MAPGVTSARETVPISLSPAIRACRRCPESNIAVPELVATAGARRPTGRFFE